MRPWRQSRVPATDGKWTISVDSLPGFGDDVVAKQIAQVVEDSDVLDDGEVGVGSTGVLSIVSDVSAPSFQLAIEIAVQRVERLLNEAGIDFPIDRERLPTVE